MLYYREKILNAPRIQKYQDGRSMLGAGVGVPDGTLPQAVLNSQDALEKSRKLYELNLRRNFEIRRLGCFISPISCGHFYRVQNGPYANSVGEGFEINTGCAFGANLNIDKPNALNFMHN